MNNWIGRLVIVGLFAALVVSAQNHGPNPYKTISAWGELPAGREWGSTSAIYPSPDGNIWVAERCGTNSCVGSDLDSVLLFDRSGKLLRSFGSGIISWPHGMHVDREGNVWIADAVSLTAKPREPGHVVLKFSPEGKLLMTLGNPKRGGSGKRAFDKPSDVLVAPNGDIFVADGHGPEGNNRIVKFSSNGKYLLEWGKTGGDTGEFRDPHALALDSQGRLFVGDRANSRIQIFTQDGKHLATWTQFGRPSGVFIDANDVIYVTDSESNEPRNPGWKRGIRIGSAKDGFVTAFIPDPETDQDNSATSGAEGVAADETGAIYAAEVGPKGIKQYVRK